MRSLVAVSLIALAGCASVPATEVSNFELCRYTMGGGQNARTAEAEAARRGLDCRPYYGAIQQQQANQNAAIQQYINTLQPRPRPAPQPGVFCTSRRVGNTVQTDCQ